MHKIYYYRDRHGNKPIEEYIQELNAKKDKNSRIKLQKIRAYIVYLSKMGMAARAPYVKHLDGDIWELRPLRDRILFAAWTDGGFLLLHHFVKKTRETPPGEIDQAKREFADWKEREPDNG
ncbi:hypothetical protein FACS1894216_11260 [Synergistales bacterium]|nr:hypothetical protein FACS1894216_11260 [Synergistales bacterium]